MRRYLAEKALRLRLTFVVAVTVDWAIPHLMPGNPVLTLMGRIQIQDPKVAAAALRQLHAGVQPRPAALEAVLLLLGLALPRRPRHEHPAVPRPSVELDHRARAAVHARPAHPGDPAQLVRRQQGRRARRAPQGARQHRAAVRLHRSPRRRTCGSRSCSPGLFAVTLAALPAPASPTTRPRPAAGRWAFILDLLHHWFLPFLVPLPRRLRRLGDRDAEHDHLRARVRLRALPRGARRAAAARPQVRVPATRCCRRSRASRSRSARWSPARSSPRSSSPTPGSATRSTARSRTRTTS